MKKTKILKQQSNLTFSGNHKSYENCDTFTFKQSDVVMDKPIYVGYAILEVSELHMYEIYYYILQPYFGEKNIQCHYMDIDSFVLSLKTENFIKD